MIPISHIQTPAVRTLVEVMASAHVQVRYARERGERLEPSPELLRAELLSEIESCERGLEALEARAARWPSMRDWRAAELALRTRLEHCRLWLAKLEAGR